VVYTRFFFIQGASSLVLSQFVSKYDPTGLFFPSPKIFTNIVVPVVMMSILFTSIVAPLLIHQQIQPKIIDMEERIELEDMEEKLNDQKKIDENGK
jgi:hypothetical protein